MSTNTQTTVPIKADYEITITLQGNNALPPDPLPIMAVGETVLYKSSVPGEVRIQFSDRSPFRTDDEVMTSVPGGVVLTLLSGSRGGFLECHCFITPKGGQEVGWGPDSPLSGGRHKVTPPS
jgi:hypothetical protein